MSQTITNNESAFSAHTNGAPLQELRRNFERMRVASRTLPIASYEERIDRLDRLSDAIKRSKDEIANAISSDFGNRSVFETQFAELLMLLEAIRYMRKHLKSWMRPEPREVALTYKPAQVKVHYQPVGVVGVIAPWNYPVQLALAPTAAALAAGNRVLIKPSEYTPRTSALLKRLCSEIFEADVVSVILGGSEVGEAFAKLPFDHLLFTGSTQVGRLVMRAAAENLVPVTLELGGKSPTIIHEDYPIERAAARIAWGKWTNAGQTCIAPDYVLVSERKLPELVQELTARTASAYPTLKDNPDYTSIVNETHWTRLKRLVDDAISRGARKTEINPSGEQLDASTRKLPPTLLTGVNDDMQVMRDEIFGPVLPIVPYKTLDDAISYVNAHERPLALYYFDSDTSRVERVLDQTISGGASINDTLMQFGCDDAPFGGIGPSGMGAYHGREGFQTFSHKRTVFYQSKWNAAGLVSPPYGDAVKRLLSMLLR